MIISTNPRTGETRSGFLGTPEGDRLYDEACDDFYEKWNKLTTAQKCAVVSAPVITTGGLLLGFGNTIPGAVIISIGGLGFIASCVKCCYDKRTQDSYSQV